MKIRSLIKKLSAFIKLFTLFLLLISPVACQKKVRYYRYEFFAMDTLFSLQIYSDQGKTATDRAANKVIRLIGDLEAKYSIFITNSTVFKLNHHQTITNDPQLENLLRQAIDFSIQTGGAFDISLYPLSELWGFYSGDHRVPESELIHQLLLRVGYSNIVIERQFDQVLISLDNKAQIDLGGMLKGYAVDEAVKLLASYKFQGGIVNAGGNVKTFGEKPNLTGWRIAIRHPRQLDNIYTVVELPPGTNLAVATSGDYERYFIQDGTRYHHILSAETGKPVNNGVISVSVIHPSAFITDVYATAIFVMGPEVGIKFAEKNHLAVMIVMQNGIQLWHTNSSLWERLQNERPELMVDLFETKDQ